MKLAAAAAALQVGFNPNPSYIPYNAPVGTVVATVIVTQSNGHPFTGKLSLTTANNTFKLVGSKILVKNEDALNQEAGTIEQLVVTATQ
jgi:hypothetical protein